MFSGYDMFTGSPDDVASCIKHATESVTPSFEFIIGTVLGRDGFLYLSSALVVPSVHQVDVVML